MTKAKRKPTKQAIYDHASSSLFAEFGLKLHRFALSELHCKPSREKWLNTPDAGNEPGQFYEAMLLMLDQGGDNQTSVALTRDEYGELKEHLAFLRRIRRPDTKAKEKSK